MQHLRALGGSSKSTREVYVDGCRAMRYGCPLHAGVCQAGRAVVLSRSQ